MKEDIKLMLPESIVNILESYDCEVYNWEHALFITQNKLWDSNIILTRKEENGEAYGKILKFKGPSNYSIEPYNQRLLIWKIKKLRVLKAQLNAEK